VDFEIILFAALVISGLIVYFDRTVSAPRREAESRKTVGIARARLPILVENSRSFFPVLLAVFLLRAFVVEPFRIPSGSMLPSLFIGDFILVSKFSYGVRLPILKTRVVPLGEPERGDVMVFRFPKDPKTNFIKRVVGLPGDVISYHNKRLAINGVPVPIKKSDLIDWNAGDSGSDQIKAFLEEFDGKAHSILIDQMRPSGSIRVTVPPGQYFVMGDNRDHSNDSRYWGFVPEQFIVGKAFFIWFSWDGAGGGGVNWQRIGSLIR